MKTSFSSQDNVSDEVFEAVVKTSSPSSSSPTLVSWSSSEVFKAEAEVSSLTTIAALDVVVEPSKGIKPKAEEDVVVKDDELAEDRPVVVVETNLEDFLDRKDRESFSRNSKTFTEQEMTMATEFIDWLEREVVEEKNFVGQGFTSRPPIVVSANNTAKKREIFEVKAASIVGDASMDRRKSSAATDASGNNGVAVDKTKFEESVDEIRDVLGRLRPSSNFPFMKQTIENLLVGDRFQSRYLIHYPRNHCLVVREQEVPGSIQPNLSSISKILHGYEFRSFKSIFRFFYWQVGNLVSFQSCLAFFRIRF